MIKYLSLFSGIGGFELGIQQAYEHEQTRSRTILQTQIGESKNGVQPKNECLRNKGNMSDSTNSCYENSTNPLCIGYSEIDKYAIQVYNKHFNHKNYGDITKIIASELPDFDLCVGGFPCPSFSIAGKRKGLQDERGELIFDIIRILKAKQPKMFLLENVKGIISHDKGKTMEIICEALCEAGYAIDFEVLNSKNFGVPQNRERCFFVGLRLDTLPSDMII